MFVAVCQPGWSLTDAERLSGAYREVAAVSCKFKQMSSALSPQAA